ncbi:ABC-2 type transport system ATP-binding protein [Saccharothrix coeruleofusca]|uniref:ABC transporter ATP-binding protein n=1 Tax=Saccharothrix coeruleofusca TaxID=33919 RepID=UPI0027DC228D|nr:ATP-binding cassette domain-containing protein [Saccharothrix coeruleofusca]MBP2335630.1 ABC-2 type transport system ATP-binding protein [Saccharothrix coeruleofusca]
MTDTVRVVGVSYRYGGVTALREVDVEFPTGVTAVLGPNGAGKSTLLGLLSTALRAQSGSVDLDGTDSVRDRRQYRRGLGFLPQSFTLPENLTVSEFLTLTAWQRLVPRGRRRAAVEEALRAVDLAGKRDVKISQLSGGMHRRVGIAQAIVNRPGVLLLDEPTVGLDPRQRRGLRELVRALGRERTVVVSTHLTEDVAATADRVVVLDEGTVRFHGTVATLTGGRGGRASDIDAAYEALVAEEGR